MGNIRFIYILIALAAITNACSSDGGSSAASTYTLSGTMDPGQSSSSLSVSMNEPDLSLFSIQPFSKTQCSDGYFYSVYCMSFSTPPQAAEGNVDCTNGGAFSVAGLPLNQPIGCFVRRYESASATTGSNIGAIEIPAQNLNGSSDTIVSSGDVQLAVTLGSNGTISAQVQSGSENIGTGDTTSTDSAFTADNMNGVWALTCDSENGGTNFVPGLCKCFLGEDSYGSAYNNQDECLADPNGAGAALSGTISLGIGLYVYTATANSDIPIDNNQTIPSGSSIKAISIWGASGSPGSYVSAKTGGEGVNNLGGSLTWATTPLDPTQAIAWSTGSSVTIKDGSSTDRTFTVPAFPVSDPANMTHGQWITWAENVASAAQAQSFDCNWGPGDSNGNQNDTNLSNNIECMNQVLEALSDDSVNATLPRIWIQPYCDQNGCLLSTDSSDSAKNYYSTNALIMSRVDIEGWHLNYPTTWASSDNNTSLAPASGEIGIEPRTRYVFEPLIVTSSGAGFRQRHDYDRHFECVSGSPNQGQVQDANCNGSGYYELVCYVVEEMAIKFMGTSSPMDVVFNQLQAPVSARLIHHDGSNKNEITPATSGGVLGMCANSINTGNGTFVAKATKQ